MLHQPILDKLSSLKLSGMLDGLREQMENGQYRKLSFEERFGLLLDREWNLRQQRKQKRRIRVVRFRESAVILDRGEVLHLAQEEWIREKLEMVS